MALKCQDNSKVSYSNFERVNQKIIKKYEDL